MTASHPVADSTGRPAPAGRWAVAAGVLRSNRLPVVLLVLFATAILAIYAVPPTTTLIFGGYVLVGIAIPGMLLVRLVRGIRGPLAEELALGLATGFCLQTASYLAARWAGLPQLHVAWAAVTLLTFALVPGLRTHWRAAGVHTPAAWSWAICLVLAGLLAYSTGVFASHALGGGDAPYVDMPYQLALIGEFRHHIPAIVPYVAGEPLAYHWFFYVQAAAISWSTGIEPVVLLYRLAVLPLVAGFVVLTAYTAVGLTGRWWVGPAAVVLALTATVAALYGWLQPGFGGRQPVLDTQPISTMWVSPTAAYGMFLLAATLTVILEALAPSATLRRRHWLLVGMLVLGASGAKAPVLPLVLAGLVTVVVVSFARARRANATAAFAAAAVLVALAFAYLFVFGGTTRGLEVGLTSLRQFPIASSVGASAARGVAQVAVPLAVLGLAIVLWSLQWGVASALVVGSRSLREDDRAWMLIGAAVAALAAAAFLNYPGLSQWYFPRAAAGIFALLAVWGGSRLLADRVPRRGLVLAAAAAVTGGVIALTLRLLGPTVAPRLDRDSLSTVLLAIGVPVIVLLISLGVALVIALVIARRVATLRATVPLVVLAAALAMGTTIPDATEALVRPVLTHAWEGRPIPDAGVDAARWLRDHSDPEDLVATNLHCYAGTAAGTCDARHFWVSAFAERRMLVEGWAYTPRAYADARGTGRSDRTVAFWDQPRLAANDLAFTSPDPGVGRLTARYPVRWLFADLTTADDAALGRVAHERYRSGEFAVFEVP